MLNGKLKKALFVTLASISIIGNVTDNEKNGIVLNPPEDGGYYISYASVEDAEIGDKIITYCVYNPFSNYDDDVIERWDFIQ